MPEYVYALHDFLPEHEDEVSFHTAERIEVVEKDDLYGDGWWRGRNLAGKVGLFPQSYTTSAPPATDTAVPPPVPPVPSETVGAPLHSLAEEPESADTSPMSPVPDIYLNGEDTESIVGPNGEVMKATMTDVQQAIEQLGTRNRGSSTNLDHDARSFSFASTRDMTTDDEDDGTDFDMSEGEGWHKDAREKLAKRARQAIADAEKLEELSNGIGSSRVTAPPIPAELSDESDDEEFDHDHEEEDHYTTSPLRDQYIPEEDEPSEPVDGLGRLRGAEEPATATAASFPIHTEVPPTPVSPGTPPPPIVPLVAPVQIEREASPLRETVVASPGPGLPSPAPSAVAAAIASKHSSVASSTAGLTTGAPSKPSSVHSAPLSAVSEGKRRDDSGHASGSGGSANGASKHPSEWTVDEVVDWLKSKGFDEDVCDKFTGEFLFLYCMFFPNCIYRARNYRRRASRSGRQSPQNRNRNHGVWKAYAHRQCHRRPPPAPLAVCVILHAPGVQRTKLPTTPAVCYRVLKLTELTAIPTLTAVCRALAHTVAVALPPVV